jgi:hypothetical protein
MGAAIGFGEGCCTAGEPGVEVTLVEFAADISLELSALAKMLTQQRHRNTRTSVVLLVAFVIRD